MCGQQALPAATHLTTLSQCTPFCDRQVDANLAAADIPLDLFDTIVSADAFERLKPSPGEILRCAVQRVD